MESKSPIGQVLKGLSKQGRIPVTELASKLGITKQSVYETFNNRISMSVEDLQRWADALQMNFQDLLEISSSGELKTSMPPLHSTKSNDALLSIKRLLEEELKEKNFEIREKNEQIRALQEALREAQQMSRVLLGKSREYRAVKVISNWLRLDEVEKNDAPAQIA